MTVKIITDSCCDIPVELAKKLNITVVPVHIHFGTKDYLDGIDIVPNDFFKMLASSESFPTTSQPSVGQYIEQFKFVLSSPPSIRRPSHSSSSSVRPSINVRPSSIPVRHSSLSIDPSIPSSIRFIVILCLSARTTPSIVYAYLFSNNFKHTMYHMGSAEAMFASNRRPEAQSMKQTVDTTTPME